MPFEKHFEQQLTEPLADPNQINGDQGRYNMARRGDVRPDLGGWANIPDDLTQASEGH